jgi:hypothetical protein
MLCCRGGHYTTSNIKHMPRNADRRNNPVLLLERCQHNIAYWVPPKLASVKAVRK